MLSSETNTVLHDGEPGTSLFIAPSETLNTRAAGGHGPDLGSALVMMALAILMYWLVPIFLLMVIVPEGSV